MKKVSIKINHQQTAMLLFFNSKEVYSIKFFDTERKARNYAKKYGYEICDLPSDVFYTSCD
ncbi:MAG: hypothetical protein ACR2K1_08325 [Saprospiraceae bacterium]